MGVSNKVMGALFKGVAADDFFNLGAGVTALALQTPENYVSKIEKDLSKPVNENSYRNLIEQKYEFDEKQKPIQYQLALRPLALDANFNNPYARSRNNYLDASNENDNDQKLEELAQIQSNLFPQYENINRVCEAIAFRKVLRLGMRGTT